MYSYLILVATFLFLTCGRASPAKEKPQKPRPTERRSGRFSPPAIAPAEIGQIPVPEGYKRINVEPTSFAAWLRQINLKKDSRVFLYNGKLKHNQSAQFAVLDIPVGKKDLQQCADAVMRLKAEYLYAVKEFSKIAFTDNNGVCYRCKADIDKMQFEQYLESVFAYCGTYSLQKQLKPKRSLNDVQGGDVLIRGGFPGHAVIVTDVAINKDGKKLYLLAQSYMPAQDIHLLKNPMDAALSPWYLSDDSALIQTPEWNFYPKDLHTW